MGLDETVNQLISESDGLVSAAHPNTTILAVESLEVRAGLRYKPVQDSLPGRCSANSLIDRGLLVGKCPYQIATKFILPGGIKT